MTQRVLPCPECCGFGLAASQKREEFKSLGVDYCFSLLGVVGVLRAHFFSKKNAAQLCLLSSALEKSRVALCGKVGILTTSAVQPSVLNDGQVSPALSEASYNQ